MTKVYCHVCGEPYDIVDGDKESPLNKKLHEEFVCNKCRALQKKIDTKTESLEVTSTIIKPWGPSVDLDGTTPQFCSECGEQLWDIYFRVFRPIEIEIDGQKAMREGGFTPISFSACPNPTCPSQKLLINVIDNLPTKMKPPWWLGLPKHPRSLEDVEKATNEHLEHHARWWFEYQKKLHPDAGKGVKMQDTTNGGEDAGTTKSDSGQR